MTRLLLAAAVVWAIGAGAALAQNYVGGIGSGNYYGGVGGGIYSYVTGTVGSAPSPPSCTNSLNFAQACNSQYIGLIQ